MSEQVQFINREKELAIIDDLIEKNETAHFLCIYADGGVGKTRLLQEIRSRYIREDRRITDIIDFDDQALHVAENLVIRIAQYLDETIFAPFLRAMDDYRKIERAGVSSEKLTEEFKKGTDSFIKCFNKLSSQKRIIILFDTIEKIQGTDYLKYVVDVFGKLNNLLCLISGRNADRISNELQLVSKETVHNVKLYPLDEKASEKYLHIKQNMLNLRIEHEVFEKTILLSGGKPIIIDLAVESLTRDIPALLFEHDIKSLSKQEKEKLIENFEHQLVSHIVQTRSQMEILFLLMSHVYPLDIPLITAILNIPKRDEAEKLFNDAKSYVFVKSLPVNRITLHDEMRRMVNAYVWNEIDPDKNRRRKYSRSSVEYIEKRIKSHNEEIQKLEDKEETKRVSLEREIWNLKAEHLKHSLFIDIDKGVELFVQTFDEATEKNQLSSREMLITQVSEYANYLKPEQQYEVDNRRIKHFQYKGNYKEAKDLAKDVLEKNILLSSEGRLDVLMLLANAEVRLGKIREAIEYFKEAVEISKLDFPVRHIKSLNGLGWAYRLTGNLESALAHYRDAQNLCLNEMISQTDKDKLRQLDEDYGLISNNLIFIMSTKRANHATAIDMALETIVLWKKTGNKAGLGACYSVLGIAYFRNASYIRSLESFQSALNIFNDLDLKSELGNTYSWRGATYLRMNNLDEAEKDFKKSLTLVTLNMKPMTLYRLGHLYFKRKQWELSEIYLRDSIEQANKIPDFTFWLLAMARLCMIPTEEFIQRFYEIHKMVKDCLSKSENPSHNSLGLVYIGLSRLLLLQNDPQKKEHILNFLKEGITLTIEYGSEAHTGILHWLELFEKDFDKVNSEIIRLIGVDLIKYVTTKERATNDLTYMKIKPILYQWAKWDRNING